jgi:hypothetical protein
MRRISCLSLVAASAVALAAAIGPDGEASTSYRCSSTSVHAVVAGRHRCLAQGGPCRTRFNAAYHRLIFHCADGSLDFWWRGLLRRPLRIPSLSAGSNCPASEAHGKLGDHGADAPGSSAFGPGPAYPTLFNDDGHARLNYVLGWGYEGWGGTKVLWTVPRYYGPYVVRGRQLDGPNELMFDQGPNWTNKLHRELRLVGPYTGLNPAATFLRAPGCYGYRVDGRGFSYLIVFEAKVVT